MDFIEDKAPIEEMLRRHEWGTLAVAGEGQPYMVPVNYAYVEGRIVFHCAFKGRKMEAIAANPRVCFCVAHQEGTVQDHPGGKPCHVDSRSVLVFGRARIVTEDDRRKRLANAFNREFRPDAADLSDERLKGCAIVEIVIDEMTARFEKDRKPVFWRHIPK
jgi:uncharacterized protein